MFYVISSPQLILSFKAIFQIFMLRFYEEIHKNITIAVKYIKYMYTYSLCSLNIMATSQFYKYIYFFLFKQKNIIQ